MFNSFIVFINLPLLLIFFSFIGKIRAQRNIVLVAGSGFGDAADSFEYLTGHWSRKFHAAPMP